MSESFDINVLREEARTRWLRPAEVYYILQNHERFPITPEPPKKPPSGSLFLYNRRVNRYFRKDGHAWRRKRDGRTVGEAHERLKVGNVDALSCYYAHGEQNPCFQRRCFWMLEYAYEHIVLVQYREVAEGRYYSSQLSNGPPESLSSLSHPNAIHGNQYHSSASGTSEGSESYQSYSNLSSLTEVTSYYVNKEHNRDSGTLLSIPEIGQTYLEQNSAVYQADNGSTTNKSGLNVAPKKIAEQLSLGDDDDDDDYIYSNQAQPLGSAKNVEAAVSGRRRVSHDPNELSLRTPGWEKPRKVAKCKDPFQIAHKSAYFDFDFDRPSPPIEKPQSTLYEEINAWIALKKQCEGGCHHTCGQKVGPELVGRNDIKQMCMENILSNRNGGTNYTVVCINAGSCHGKTSLLCDLYNDQQLIDAFDKRMWIQMPDKLDMPVLLRKIVESASNAHCSITNPSYLQEMVEEEITDKKIVLFMDDADIQDQQFWNSTFKVLNASARGSVIVMATRSAIPVAHIGIAIHSYSLSPLSEEFNLVLLQQYAALEIDVPSHPDLVMVAKRLISRFGTNPLNLKAIGGLLSHTDTISLQNHMFEENIMPLQLCHDVLPAHLKKCLAFCSLFPEGYIFDRRHIVLLWISNGCVRPVEGCELEHVGAEYFNELLCRSFFQNSPFHNGKDEKFVMHKLIYKVIESVSRSRYYKSEDLISSVPENIRHLSIASSQIQTVVKLMPLTENLKDLLTFLVVQPDWQQYRTYCPTLNLVGLYDFFLKFTSMETLDLSHTDIEELPGSIVSMRNLQYLCLNDTRIRALPSELCSLSNLLTLKAKNCRFLTELPGDTKKLLKLRHLDVTKDLGYVLLPQGIGQLTELRTLPVFHANADSSRCSISELGYLRSLRGFLCLSGLECVKTSCKAQEINLKHKQHLQDVTLQWHGGDADIDEDDDDEAENVAEQVLGALEPHANLQELAIRGYEGNAFPGWIQSPFSLPSLVSLTLDSCCNCTQFPSIAQLPSLKFLSVRKMYDVQRLSSAVNGATRFPSLELLNLWEIYGMEELFEASEGDCPRLRKICISRCPDLKRLPCIPSVTELVVHCCHQLPDVPELASLSSLKIEGLYGVESFSLTPASLPVLKKLEIRSCKGLSWVYGLEELTTVQRLKITGCPKLVSPRTRGIWRPE